MQIGEENLFRLQKFTLTCQRLFHFDDHLRLGENLRRRFCDCCASTFEIAVHAANANANIFFHHHLVAVTNIFAHGLGRKANAVFVVFNFFWNADEHGLILLAWRIDAKSWCFFRIWGAK